MDNKLAEIEADKKKIALYIGLRMPLLLIIIVAFIVPVPTAENPNYVAAVVLLVLFSAFVLSPLRHLKDKLVFYENKVVFNKKELSFIHPSEVKWTIVNTYFMGRRLKIKNASEKKVSLKDIFYDASEIDITYIKNSKDEFIKCYFK